MAIGFTINPLRLRNEIRKLCIDLNLNCYIWSSDNIVVRRWQDAENTNKWIHFDSLEKCIVWLRIKKKSCVS